MDEIENLIQQTTGRGKKAEIAAGRLSAKGISAIPPIIAAIRTLTDRKAWQLSKVLVHIRDPKAVPIFLDLIDEENPNLALPAFKVLGSLKDPRALPNLTKYLADPENHNTRRSLAANAIGELGKLEAIEDLLLTGNRILEDPDVATVSKGETLPDDSEIDEGELLLLLSLAIALAKLGNHQMSSLVVALIRYRSSDVYSEDQIIRTKAAEALQYIIGPGIWTAMKEAIQDDYHEVRLKATDAMFYLGAKETVSELIMRVEDINSDVRENALIRISDLTGKNFSENAQRGELEDWWRKFQPTLSEDVCYRMGEPICLPKIIELLQTPRWMPQIIQELKIITGNDFGFSIYSPPERQKFVLKYARRWWSQEQNKYEKGQLYKYGHKKTIATIFRSPGET